jgi:pathogenesis-related protein 1
MRLAKEPRSPIRLREGSHLWLVAIVLAMTSACEGAIDDREEGEYVQPGPPGPSAGLDAGGMLGGAPPAPATDAAAPGAFDAAPGLPPGMDATPPRDATGATDVSVPRDVAPPPMQSGGDPEPGRLAGITAAHNAVRARVNSTTPLPPLEWGADIYAVAQAYAEKLAASCSTTLQHSSSQERNGWGENLAMVGGFGSAPAGSAQQAVDLWESELDCYTFGAFQSGVNATCSNACSRYGGCGHYTQLVWRKTRRVGCGVAECTSGSTKRSYWVCNYDPPGNYIGQLPY